MNFEQYKMAQSFAIEYGTILGVVWLAAFGCVVGSLTGGGLFVTLSGLCLFGLSALVPFILAWRFKQHLDKGERVSGFTAWTFAFLMFTYACIFAGVGHLIYFTYIDHGQMLHAIQNTLSAPEIEAQYKTLGADDMLRQAREQMAVIQTLTPWQMTLALFENNIFISLLLTIPVTFVARLKAVAGMATRK